MRLVFQRLKYAIMQNINLPQSEPLAAVARPPSGALTTCPKCNTPIRIDRLRRHLQIRCPELRNLPKSTLQNRPLSSALPRPKPVFHFSTGPCPYCKRVISGKRMASHRAQCHFQQTNSDPPNPRRLHREGFVIERCSCGAPVVPGDACCYLHMPT